MLHAMISTIFFLVRILSFADSMLYLLCYILSGFLVCPVLVVFSLPCFHCLLYQQFIGGNEKDLGSDNEGSDDSNVCELNETNVNGVDSLHLVEQV